jgi:predicted ABC-type ATPase
MYLELVDDWLVIDNSRRQPFIVASGTRHTMPVVTDPRAWARLRRAAGAQ